MTPTFSVTVNGQDISDKVSPRIIGISITDERGFESDTCEISIDDTDQHKRVEFPPTKAKITIALGYKETGTVLTGEYIVDGYSHSGDPDMLTIRGKSATQTVTSGLKLRKTRSWHDTTIGAILSQIASENSLEAAITPAIAAKTLKSVQQSNESTQHFLTRLAERNGAFFKVSHGKLLFMQRGKSETVSGKSLPAVLIERKDGDAHQFEHPEAPQYDGVQAEYRDHKKAQAKSVAVGKEGGNLKTLRKTYKSSDEAKDAAEAAQADMDQSAETITLNLAFARAGIQTEGKLKLSGFHPQIDGDTWVCVSVSTSLGDGGLVQTVRAERKIV